MKAKLLAIVSGLLLLASLSACWGGGGSGYPAAGEDHFAAVHGTLQLALGEGDANTASVDLAGSAVVRRQESETGNDGLQSIMTELVDLQLQGNGDFGSVTVHLHPDKRSHGGVRQQKAGKDFPADGYFQLFLEIVIADENLTVRNETQLPVVATLMTVPPAAGKTFELAENFNVAVYTSDAQQVGTVESLTLTFGPAETTDITTPEAGG
ncbi:MAG: DUF6073 family protein [Dehalococcoidia bacterium]